MGISSCGLYDAYYVNQLADAVGQELVREELIGHYVQLLKDNEAEVRTAAAGQIPGTSCLTISRFLYISNSSSM